MGTFSFFKADGLTRVANIVEGRPFKFLIPKEFGGGYILEKYQGYGYVGKTWIGVPRQDMFELLAIWNAHHPNQEAHLRAYNNVLQNDEYDIPPKQDGQCMDDYVYQIAYQFGGHFWSDDDAVRHDIHGARDYYSCLDAKKCIDDKTYHNHNLGLQMGRHPHQIENLRYPLKLVIASYKGTYEDCENYSLPDDQSHGLWPIYRY